MSQLQLFAQTQPLAPPPPLANGLQPKSCLRCARHKVRCDRLNPCSRCGKSGVTCEFPVPKEGRRRRKTTTTVTSSSTSNNITTTSSTTTTTANPITHPSSSRTTTNGLSASISSSTTAARWPSVSASSPSGSSSTPWDDGNHHHDQHHNNNNTRLSARIDLYEQKLKSLGVDIESIQQTTTAAGAKKDQIPTPLPTDITTHAAAGNPRSTRAPFDPDATSGQCPFAETVRFFHQPAYATGGEGEGDGGGGRGGGGDTLSAFSRATSLSVLPGSAIPHETIDLPSQKVLDALWPIYLRNVHPITMIVHPATTGALLAETINKTPEQAPPGAIALLFAVITAAVTSMEGPDCVEAFGSSQSMLISKYRAACELGLIRGEFLRSCNFLVLQAYTVYLHAVSADLDPRELWNLTGIARRNAQRLSLHEPERVKGLTIFDREMRRRLWHEISTHDAASAQASSSQWIDTHLVDDVEAPINYNDRDLSPSMSKTVEPREGATDMMFCILRFKIIKFGGRIHEWCRDWRAASGDTRSSDFTQQSIAESDEILRCMEKELELNVLRYCDILNPTHVLAASVARLALCKQRFTLLKMIRSGSGGGTRTWSFAGTEADEELLRTAIHVLKYENNVLTQAPLRGFLWFTCREFFWPGLVHILQCLKARPHAAAATMAWEQVGKWHELRPSGPQRHRGKHASRIHTALDTLTIEAWQARESPAAERGEVLSVPPFITLLRGQFLHVVDDRLGLGPGSGHGQSLELQDVDWADEWMGLDEIATGLNGTSMGLPADLSYDEDLDSSLSLVEPAIPGPGFVDWLRPN